MLVSYISCASDEKIKIVDDSLALMPGMGQISPFEGLSLHNLVHVLKILYNLLSISKITRELNCNCKAKFLFDYVSFQDFSLGRMISIAKHCRGLDDDASSSSICRTSLLFHTLLLLKKTVCCDISV